PGVVSCTMPYAILIVGANDVSSFVDQLTHGGNPSPGALVAGLVGNVNAALNVVQGAGKVGVVLGTVPDISKTPRFQAALQLIPDPAQRAALAQAVTGLTQAVNAQLL